MLELEDVLRRTARRRLTAARPVLLVLLAAVLAGASPSGCNGWDNVGLVSSHLAAGSPDAQDSSFEHPVIVTRDNPWFVGAFFSDPGISGDPGSAAYSAHGSWNGFVGSVELEELWSPTVSVGTQRLPVLPMQPYQGPGQATWSSRSGDLVHGNTYAAELHAWDGGHIDSNRRLYARLSNDVQLVPIVVISWKKPGSDPSFVDHTHIAKSLFDFIPYDAPRYQASELSPSGVLTPNQGGHTITPPKLWETPPDDIWSQCSVQFQVVGSYVFELPPNHQPNCNVQSTTFPGLSDIQSRIKSVDPGVGSLIVDDLHPVYVAYGDFGSCAGAQGYTGKVVGGLPLAEVHYGRTKVTTSHEIGHVLLGSSHATHDGAPIQGNLMRVNPSDGDDDLTSAQCEQAQASAGNYSARYRDFNRRTGRIDPGSFELAGLGGGMSVVPGTTGTTDILTTLSERCCEVQSNGSTYLAAVCGIGAVPVPDAQCQTCCSNEQQDDAHMSFDDECPEGHQLASAQCDEICCSEFDPSLAVARYACGQAGGYEIPCELAPPN